ncbi:hypothetical protein ACJIZ3_018711 [Penstemon smallii]|uniref:Uncharacterized protein n=1 Tax=Penstemon smallii TaxID=265156 RepID=A0ABD3SZ55_9LAMI
MLCLEAGDGESRRMEVVKGGSYDYNGYSYDDNEEDEGHYHPTEGAGSGTILFLLLGCIADVVFNDFGMLRRGNAVDLISRNLNDVCPRRIRGGGGGGARWRVPNRWNPLLHLEDEERSGALLGGKGERRR